MRNGIIYIGNKNKTIEICYENECESRLSKINLYLKFDSWGQRQESQAFFESVQTTRIQNNPVLKIVNILKSKIYLIMSTNVLFKQNNRCVHF